MAASSSTTNLAPILEEVYEKLKNEQLYKNKPFFQMLRKKQTFDGSTHEVPLRYSPEPGGSAVFASALANRGPSGFTRFAVTRRKDYAVGSIETELVRAAKSNGAAVVSAVEAVIRGLKNTAERSICKSLYGNSGGARAQVGSGQASNTITLLNTKDIVWFEPGMVLDGSAADGLSGAVTTGGVAAKIISIDRDAGTLTNDTSANWNAATGINGLNGAGNWYLFRQGDFGATMHGLDAWIPATVTSTTFFGVNRTLDSERLAGCRITPTTTGYTYSTVEGAITAILERVYMAGGAPDTVFIHPQRFKRLSDELGAKVERVEMKDAQFSFSGIRVHGQGGQATVVSDPCCPRDTGWALSMDTWTLNTLGAPFSILDDDGKGIWLREGADDAMQARLATFGNLYCDAPAYNGRFSLTGITLCRRGAHSLRCVTRRPTRSFSKGPSPPQAAVPPPIWRAPASPWRTCPRVGGRSRSWVSPTRRSSRSSPGCSSTRRRLTPSTCR